MVMFREALWGGIVIMEDRKYLLWAVNDTVFYADAMIQRHKINKSGAALVSCKLTLTV